MSSHRKERFSVIDADADELAEHYKRTLTSARVEPIDGRGRIRAEDQHFNLGPWSLWGGICHSGMKVSFSEACSDCLVLYLPIAGGMELKSGRLELQSEPGAASIIDMSRVSSLALAPGRSHMGLAIDRSVLVRTMSEMIDAPVGHCLEFSPHIDMSTGKGARLNELAGVIWRSLEAGGDAGPSSFFVSELLSALTVVILEAGEHSYSHRLSKDLSPAMPRQVKKALDYMHANMAGKIEIGDLAKASGSSIRALQLAFRGFTGDTPLNYLRNLRLAGARRQLADPDNLMPVSEVARSWGFFHMGRFAQSYRQAYGELPSESRVGNE